MQQTSQETPADDEAQPKAETERHFIRYLFFRVSPEWKRLPDDERERSKQEFVGAVREIAEAASLRSYSLVGTRSDVDFMLWMTSKDLEQLHAVNARLNTTHLGRHSETPYSLLAMTRPSPYVPRGRRPKEAEFESAKYLFVYPFVKTREWYTRPQAWRTAMMREHIAISAKFPAVRINTGYSYGLDDQEHVVAFETDNAPDFLDLVMALRESEQSSYTLRDTPIFSCITADIGKALNAIAG